MMEKMGVNIWKEDGEKIRENRREETVGEESGPEGYSHQGRRGWGHSNVSSMSTATSALGSASAPHRLCGRAGDPPRISPTRSPTETQIPHLSCRKRAAMPSFNLCPASTFAQLQGVVICSEELYCFGNGANSWRTLNTNIPLQLHVPPWDSASTQDEHGPRRSIALAQGKAVGCAP